MGYLYALDFDGVLCDSCGESSIFAVKAAKGWWPSLFDGVEPSLEDWIVDQIFYPGVPDALKFASSKLYIVTIKQSRFADALLRELAGVAIPVERINGIGTGFVEDRFATLKNVIKEPELNNWNVYLGDWGYNTQKERDEVGRHSQNSCSTVVRL